MRRNGFFIGMRSIFTDLVLAPFLLTAFMIAGPQAASAQYYVTTGQSGAQTQIDSAPHMSTFMLSVTAPVTFGGGKFTMKRGSASSATVEYTLYSDNTGACSGPSTVVSLNASSFTTQFNLVDFLIPGNASLGIGLYWFPAISRG